MLSVDRVSGASTVLAGDVTAAGSIDGVGSEARFNGPHGLATDGANLYIADSGNDTIRKVGIGSGQVVTLAGQAGVAGSTDGLGAASLLNNPQGVAVGGAALWITDTGQFHRSTAQPCHRQVGDDRRQPRSRRAS